MSFRSCCDPSIVEVDYKLCLLKTELGELYQSGNTSSCSIQGIDGTDIHVSVVNIFICD